MTDAALRKLTCCKKLRCFRHVNFEFYLTNAKRLFNASITTRRDILKSFIGSDNEFRYDGRIVCVRFLKEAFHFSTVMIAEVSSGNVTRPVRSRTPSTSQLESAQSANGVVVSSLSSLTCSPSDVYSPVKKEAIISFLIRTAEDCGDSMPHKKEVHLPFHQIQEVFPVFDREFRKLYPSATPVTAPYFRTVWVEHCRHIKVVKSSRFAKCDVCESLRMKLRARIISGESTTHIQTQRRVHLSFVSAERLEYQKKKDRARLHSNEYCSIIVDGADESAFGLPHFTTKSKSQRGHAMKVKVVGLLEHQIENRLFLYTMTQEHQTGANHVVEVIHRFLAQKRQEGPLPKKFYIQLDNCSRENKNRFMMGYLEMLVAANVFDSVECGFLPVGHTHEDVDQAFSTTSGRLRVTNAITLEELQGVLRTAYGGRAQVEHLKRVANWSGLCQQEGCLRTVERITHWRYFSFVRESASETIPIKRQRADTQERAVAVKRRTAIYVKKDCDDKWQKLYPSAKSTESGGILRACPNLAKTPPTNITCPDGLHEVNKRLWSEDERINDSDKMIALNDLRDFVFQSRTDPFHWDLELSVETEATLKKSTINANDTPDLQVLERYSDDELQDDDITPAQTLPASSDARARSSNDESEGDSEGDEENDTGTSNAHRTKKVPHSPNNKVDYEVGSFVVVQPKSTTVDNSEHSDEISSERDSSGHNKVFWVAKVLGTIKHKNESFATTLRVHWFDCDGNNCSSPDLQFMKYSPCYQESQRKRRKPNNSKSRPTRKQLEQPWVDTIHTDTVLVSFAGLTMRRTIPLSVQKRLGR